MLLFLLFFMILKILAQHLLCLYSMYSLMFADKCQPAVHSTEEGSGTVGPCVCVRFFFPPFPHHVLEYADCSCKH